MLKRVSISVDNYFILFIIITHSFGCIVFVRRFFLFFLFFFKQEDRLLFHCVL